MNATERRVRAIYERERANGCGHWESLAVAEHEFAAEIAREKARAIEAINADDSRRILTGISHGLRNETHA